MPKTQTMKRAEATERKEARSKLSNEEQLHVLDGRRGKSTRERSKLRKQLVGRKS